MSTSTLPTVEATKSIPATLKLADRCDACGLSSQAFVRVQIVSENVSGSGELDFCGHHYDRYAPQLLIQGGRVIQDARSTINTKPSISANSI